MKNEKKDVQMNVAADKRLASLHLHSFCRPSNVHCDFQLSCVPELNSSRTNSFVKQRFFMSL